MREIDYKKYFDKVYGCMIGKCVSGTAGAPYEGMKQRLTLHFTAEEADTTLPNDDLDLQVLWLEVLEKKGVSVTSDDLADIFLECCPYCPGEYAVFKKNYRRHIHPPYSGSYNNPYYLEGMGCPIRSEIWACIATGNPELSSELAKMDGVLDHGENSVWGECFLAALEAEAFFESDIHVLIEKGLQYIPDHTRMYALITDVQRWCGEYENYDVIYRKLIREYGHPDCTNVFQNMGIIIYALLKGDGDLLKSTELAVNAGYDTDCTGATVGAILGLVLGADELKKQYGFSDQTFSLGVKTCRRSDKISDLAEDICRVGQHFVTKKRNDVRIKDCPLMPLEPDGEQPDPLRLSVRYEGKPVVGPKHVGKAVIVMQNHTSEKMNGVMKITSKTLIPEISWMEVSLEPEEIRELPMEFGLPESCVEIADENVVYLEFTGDVNTAYSFGFAGAVPWSLYGPYWENVFHVQTLIPGQSYMEQFPGGTREERTDLIRDYHLNAAADIGKSYLDLQMLSTGEEMEEKQVVYTYEDRIRVSDLVNYEGPCTLFLSRSFYSPTERDCRLYIGYSDAFCLWLNGEKWQRGQITHGGQVKMYI